MDLSKHLTPASRSRLEAVRAEATRLYEQDNLGLAQSLLRLSKEGIELHPEFNPKQPTYEVHLLYWLLPELARRLGADVASVGETGNGIRLSQLTATELRRHVGVIMYNQSVVPNSFVFSLLNREWANGNPLVFAIDRICAGDLQDRDDLITNRIAEIASYRKRPYSGVWTPEVLSPADASFTENGA